MKQKTLSQATTYCSEAEYLPNSLNATQLCSSIRRSQRLLEKSLITDSKRTETSMNFRFKDDGQLQKSNEAPPQGTYQISVSKRNYYVSKSSSPQLFDKLDENINFLIQQQMQSKDLTDSLPLSQITKKAITKRRISSSRDTLPAKCLRKLESTTRIRRLRQVRKPRGRPPNQNNVDQLLTSRPKNAITPTLRGLKNILEQGQGNESQQINPFSFTSAELDSSTVTRDPLIYSRPKNVNKPTTRGVKNLQKQGNVPVTFTSTEQTSINWKMDSATTSRDSLVYSRPKNVNKSTTRGLKNLLEQEQATFTSAEEAAINWKMDSATTSRNSANLNLMTATSSSNQTMPTNSFVLLPMENYYNPPVGDKPILDTGVNNNNKTKSIQNTVYPLQSDIAGTAAGKSIHSHMKGTFKRNAKVPLSSCVLPPIERYYNPPIEEKPMSATGLKNNPSLDPTVNSLLHFDGPTTARKSVNPNMRGSFKTNEDVPMKPYHDPPTEEKPTLAAGVINNPSMLPAAYPPHFVHQLPPTTIAGNQQSAEVSDAYYESQAPFFDNFGMDLSPSPPLSDSWNEIFGGKNLREVLNIEPIRYRLTEEQLAAVALIMNVEVARLRGVMNLVQKLPQSDITKMAAEINGKSADSEYQLSNDVNSLLERYETSRSPSICQHKNLIPTE